MTVEARSEQADLLSPTRVPLHAYDHPAFRIFSKNHEITPVQISLEQQDLISQQLSRIDPDLAVDTMGAVLLRSRIDRDRWERQHVRILGFNALMQYKQFAGDYQEISRMIEWFGRLTGPLESNDQGIIDSSGVFQLHGTMDDVKGPTFAVGTAEQGGDWLKSELLDYSINLALGELVDSRKYDVEISDVQDIRRHKIQILTDGGVLEPRLLNSAQHMGTHALGLYVIRERALANIIPRYGRRRSARTRARFKDTLHLTKRSSAIVIPDAATLRTAIESVATYGNISISSGDDQSDQDESMLELIEQYEELIHRDHEVPLGVDDIDISPVEMTVLMRNPKNK